METWEGARQDLPQVTELISLKTSQSQVTDLGLRLRSRLGLPTVAVLALFLGLSPNSGKLGLSVTHSKRLMIWFLSSHSEALTRQHLASEIRALIIL